ncbi:hypothetical protein QAD02_006057 [Eretmocerus hayati]|uniref:Uncharacterized protein n=1 Tax=Eretmocerus hayati TaxID=131215 RepID=A0ACC2N3Y0_9HYME|nr:hypothetical protein QAD02_006057 [Eretmocerus hayati]
MLSHSDGSSAPPASPLGSLQPDLYQRKDGPLFLSSTRRSGKSLGQLHLRLSYDFDKSDLEVHLIEAQELASSDQGGFNDPYVKLTLSPEVDSRKRQTEVHRNDSNICFDQHFKFPVSYDELHDKTLNLQVLDSDRFSRNDVVGSVRIALEELELQSLGSDLPPLEVWSDIGRERKPPEEVQEVLISLSYLPSAERLTLTVHRARNLFPPQASPTSSSSGGGGGGGGGSKKTSLDPFCKVALLCGERRVRKKKTCVLKSTRCPEWNEAMTFKVPASALSTSAFEICVLDTSSDQNGKCAMVGSCIIGPGLGGSGSGAAIESVPGANPGREHWHHMQHSPRESVAMWHPLH